MLRDSNRTHSRRRHAARIAAFTLLMGVGVAFGAEPKEWLERMNKALTTQNYVGVFTYVHGGRVETLRIIHRVRGRDVSERLLSLDGSGREFIREGDELICYFPDRAPCWSNAVLQMARCSVHCPRSTKAIRRSTKSAVASGSDCWAAIRA